VKYKERVHIRMYSGLKYNYHNFNSFTGVYIYILTGMVEDKVLRIYPVKFSEFRNLNILTIVIIFTNMNY
jgi:hypothetical protein